MLGQLIRIILAFAVVLLLAYYATRFLGASGRLSRARKPNLRVLEAITISQQNSVQLVRAGSKHLLLGVSKERVTLLAELDETELDVSQYAQTAAPVPPFEKVLGKLMKPRAAGADVEEAKDDNE